jgi:hypothetical protein
MTPTATFEPAPEAIFIGVGATSEFSGEHNVSGKAVIAGLQTLIIMRFHFDGKGPQADLRLVLGENATEPTAILAELEPRAYENEFLQVRIPGSVGPGTADRLIVYCPETGEVYATAIFTEEY